MSGCIIGVNMHLLTNKFLSEIDCIPLTQHGNDGTTGLLSLTSNVAWGFKTWITGWRNYTALCWITLILDGFSHRYRKHFLFSMRMITKRNYIAYIKHKNNLYAVSQHTLTCIYLHVQFLYEVFYLLDAYASIYPSLKPMTQKSLFFLFPIRFPAAFS